MHENILPQLYVANDNIKNEFNNKKIKGLRIYRNFLRSLLFLEYKHHKYYLIVKAFLKAIRGIFYLTAVELE